MSAPPADDTQGDTPDAAWARLEHELAAWRAAGRTATLWWRDDDAGEATPALRRLLDLATRHGLPLTLATVPAWATPELAAAVEAAPTTLVVQHGYAHHNYAPVGEKAAELGTTRPAQIVVAELAQGMDVLANRFGRKFHPVLVPPWNRMALYLPPFVAELRYAGLSQFGARSRAQPVRGLTQVNTHVDIVNWKTTPRRAVGAGKLLDEYTRHLAARRAGTADPAEATGLLTHHAVHDEECWAFLDGLFARLGRHPAVTWLDAAALFAPPPLAGPPAAGQAA